MTKRLVNSAARSVAILTIYFLGKAVAHMAGVGEGLSWVGLPVFALVAWNIGQGFSRRLFVLAGVIGTAVSWLVWKTDWIYFIFLNEHVLQRADDTDILRTAPFVEAVGFPIAAIGGVFAAISAWRADAHSPPLDGPAP
jgi:hypothetical protein